MNFTFPPALTVLDIVGADAARVLNNLCTAPILQLVRGQGHEAFVTEVRGRTLGHVVAYAVDDGRIRLIGAAGQAEVISAHLDRYTIREDAAAEDHGNDFRALLVDAAALAQLAAERAAPLAAAELPLLACGTLAATAVGGGGEITLYQVPWTGQEQTLVLAPAAAIDELVQRLTQAGAQQFDAAAFHAARVAHRFPWFGIDLDDRNLPQEADRDVLAISFTKGCYLGQETVARLDALGQVQKKLVLWRIDAAEAPPAGTELTAQDRVVGRLTSVAPAADGGFVALGFARRSHFDSGATATYGDPPHTATVAGN